LVALALVNSIILEMSIECDRPGFSLPDYGAATVYGRSPTGSVCVTTRFAVETTLIAFDRPLAS